MKRKFSHIAFSLLALLIANGYSTISNAQVKIGNNPTLLNPSAILEVESTNKGILLPRVALVAPSNPAPLAGFVSGMFIYNTATTDSITPGLYYAEGTKWLRVNAADTSGGSGWKLTGNTGTSATNFLGTADMAPLSIKTNSTERLHITANGWIGIGTNTPAAALQIKGQLVIDSLNPGNTATDSLLVVNPADGRVKAVSALGFVSGVRKKLDIVATAGQTIFTTPVTITDANKISLYRNGVLISFTVNSPTSIEAEIACAAGDEIRIIQLL